MLKLFEEELSPLHILVKVIIYNWVKPVDLIKEIIIYKDNCDSWLKLNLNLLKTDLESQSMNLKKKTIKISKLRMWNLNNLLKNKYHPEGESIVVTAWIPLQHLKSQ